MSLKSNTKIVTLPEFSVSKFISYLFTKKRTILLVMSVTTLLGLTIALTSPDEYRTNTILLPENSSGSSISSLKGLAGLAGISLSDDQEGGINPEIYPQILNSTPFLTSLLEEKFFFAEAKDSLTLYEFFSEYQKISLVSKITSFPFYILRTIRGEETSASKVVSGDFVYLNKAQLEAIEELKSRIVMSVDINTGLITITGKMQDPIVVAEMTSFTLDYVSKYVRSYYVQKEKVNLNFITDRYEEAKEEFQNSQRVLASFRDQNRAIGLESARIEEQRLQSEYEIRFNVYNTLAQQLEESKIAVQEKIPVYTVLEPVKIPFETAEPQRLVILIFSFFLGIFLSLGICLVGFIYGLDKENF